MLLIRASVDALYRDGGGQISRDPHTKRYHIWRECFPRASKLRVLAVFLQTEYFMEKHVYSHVTYYM